MPTKKRPHLPVAKVDKTPTKQDDSAGTLDVVRQVLLLLVGVSGIVFAIVSIAMPSVPAGVLAVCFIRAFAQSKKDDE